MWHAPAKIFDIIHKRHSRETESHPVSGVNQILIKAIDSPFFTNFFLISPYITRGSMLNEVRISKKIIIAAVCPNQSWKVFICT
jgi:hypothetical protein